MDPGRVHWLSLDQSPLDPTDDEPVADESQQIIHTSVVRGGPEGIRRYTASSPAPLWPLIPSARISPDEMAAVECDTRLPTPLCSAWLIQRRAIVTSGDIVRASWGVDDSRGEPFVSLALGAAGSARFGVETEANVGRQLAVVIDGNIAMRPVVNIGIHNGRISLHMMESRLQARMARAKEYAAAFTAPLRGTWHVVEFASR